MSCWSGQIDQQQINQLRGMPLSLVAEACGYQRDPGDQNRWRRSGSVLSITGSQFYDHLKGTGGGGAIDLVIHVRGCGFGEALAWLEQVSCKACQPAVPPCSKTVKSDGRCAPLAPSKTPVPDLQLVPRSWPRVWTYLVGERHLAPELVAWCNRKHLVGERHLAPELVAWCNRKHLVGADQRGNAVFITRDAKAVPVGAEVRL